MSIGVCGAALVAACALPGPQQALAPRLNGLTEIAPGIWSDAPERAVPTLDIVGQGRARALAFHETADVGRIILCHLPRCAHRMGIQTLGKAYGRHMFLAAPGGINPEIIGHEFSHVGLHHSLGTRITQVPRWFDEGLAVWLSPDARYRRPTLVDDALWITQARSLRDWKRMTTQDTWPDTYGAAGRMVEAMAAEIGEGGLRALIAAVADGADFADAYHHLGGALPLVGD